MHEFVAVPDQLLQAELILLGGFNGVLACLTVAVYQQMVFPQTGVRALPSEEPVYSLVEQLSQWEEPLFLWGERLSRSAQARRSGPGRQPVPIG